VVNTFKIEGLAELEKTFLELGKANTKNALVKALMEAVDPIKDAAEALAPKDSGKLIASIIKTKKKPKNYESGKIAYNKTMKDGGDRKAAVSAMREARRKNPATFAEVFVGVGSRITYALSQEFGTVHSPAQPFMRPAFDDNQQEVVDILSVSIAENIEKSRKRQAAKAAKLLAKMK